MATINSKKKAYALYPDWGEDLAEVLPVQIIESKRRSVSLEVKLQGGRPVVILKKPLQLSQKAAEAYAVKVLMEREAWVRVHVNRLKRQQRLLAKEQLTEEDLKLLKKAARKDLKQRLDYYAPLVGVTYTGLQIRKQKSRWGSCSSTGTISLNCLLMLLPEEIRDYVVVHELCHRKEMNHSALFWQEVAKVLPDYKARRKQLRDHGTAILSLVT